MISYSLKIRNARLTAARDALNGGALEITDADGARLASIALETKSGDVISGSLLFAGFPVFAMAERKGTAAKARFVDSAGDVAAVGLTVGLADADIILGKIEIELANVVKIERAEIRS